MKNILISTSIAVLMASNSMVSFAGSVPDPIEFFSGQTALASEVNTNFNNITPAVNDNDTRIGVNETDIADNTAAIEALGGSTTCPNDNDNDMVAVGSLCVDKYEASLWDAATGGNQLTATDPAPYYTCEANGSDCGTAGGAGVAIYARSVTDVTPAQRVTWLQAVQACANVGKRLPTAAEWQMAAAGTPEGVGDGTTGKCNSESSAGNVVQATGFSGANCRSTAGAEDMVGNLWEWVADISPAGAGGYATADTTTAFAAMAFGAAFDNPSLITPSPRVSVNLDGTFNTVGDDGLLTTNSRNGFRCVR